MVRGNHGKKFVASEVQAFFFGGGFQEDMRYTNVTSAFLRDGNG